MSAANLDHAIAEYVTSGGELEPIGVAGTGRQVIAEHAEAERRAALHDQARCAAELIAAVCHDANASWSREFDGDSSHLPWRQAPEWQRKSSVEGVRAVIAEPAISSEALHNRWCQSKEAAGWVYGPTKDADARTHPCLLPYSMLPLGQRAKDALFSAIVRALAPVLIPGWGTQLGAGRPAHGVYRLGGGELPDRRRVG